MPRKDNLVWCQAENETAFVAITPGRTFRVKWLPDLHVWTFDGRAFEHHDMAKSAAQATYDNMSAQP